jgi:hypothetical protein
VEFTDSNIPSRRAATMDVLPGFRRPGLLVALTFVAFGALRAAEPPAERILSPESQATYDKRVKPFVKQHCLQCHDAKTAEAGFVLEGLGIDFLAGKTANHWREAVDKINLGKMPPKEESRPDPKEAFAVTEWVNQELRNAEKRAQSAGGRVPMRRLNRTEYANTVRDLFQLEENFARKIELELPSDGKVDGFDRGGAALFVDKSQLQAYLDVARMGHRRGPAGRAAQIEHLSASGRQGHQHAPEGPPNDHDEGNPRPGAAVHEPLQQGSTRVRRD